MKYILAISRFLEARLGKPSLVRETSRYSAAEAMKHPFKFVRKLYTRPLDPLKGIILEVSTVCPVYKGHSTVVMYEVGTVCPAYKGHSTVVMYEVGTVCPAYKGHPMVVMYEVSAVCPVYKGHSV